MSSELVYLRDLDGSGSMHVCAATDAGAVPYVPETTLTARLSDKDAEIARLRGELEFISNLEGEINPSNYDHDDACNLNRSFCEAITVAAAALEPKP